MAKKESKEASAEMIQDAKVEVAAKATEAEWNKAIGIVLNNELSVLLNDHWDAICKCCTPKLHIAIGIDLDKESSPPELDVRIAYSTRYVDKYHFQVSDPNQQLLNLDEIWSRTTCR